MIRHIVAAAALLLLASPVAAAPLDDVRCVVDDISASSRSAIVDDMIENGPNGRIVQRNLIRRAQQCAERGRWSAERAGDAGALAGSILMRDEIRRRLAGRGIEPARFDQWFARQSDAFRTTAFMTMSEEEATRTLETLTDTGLPPERLEQLAPEVGRYLASLVVIERATRGMPLFE